MKKNNLKTKGFIISNPDHSKKNSNLQLLRVTVSDVETKFDFGYQATNYYVNGGWIKISPDTFIKDTHSDKKHTLSNATNIPYGPEKLHFNSTIEWRYFSLHFPPISMKITNIDLIEKENGTANDFNFYGIRLDDESKKSLL
jgi:hypothetical protein